MTKRKDLRSLGQVLEIRLGAFPPRIQITTYCPGQLRFPFARRDTSEEPTLVDEHEGQPPGRKPANQEPE